MCYPALFLITFMYRVLNLVNRLTVCATCIKIIMASPKRGQILTVVVMNTPFLVFITSVREVIRMIDWKKIAFFFMTLFKFYCLAFILLIVIAFQLEVFKALLTLDHFAIRALFNL